jgi:hypothetical protein
MTNVTDVVSLSKPGTFDRTSLHSPVTK